jgi:hypothetical protein
MAEPVFNPKQFGSQQLELFFFFSFFVVMMVVFFSLLFKTGFFFVLEVLEFELRASRLTRQAL